MDPTGTQEPGNVAIPRKCTGAGNDKFKSEEASVRKGCLFCLVALSFSNMYGHMHVQSYDGSTLFRCLTGWMANGKTILQLRAQKARCSVRHTRFSVPSSRVRASWNQENHQRMSIPFSKRIYTIWDLRLARIGRRILQPFHYSSGEQASGQSIGGYENTKD